MAVFFIKIFFPVFCWKDSLNWKCSLKKKRQISDCVKEFFMKEIERLKRLLDFDLVAEQISKSTHTIFGKEVVLSFHPGDGIKTARWRHTVVTEMRELLSKEFLNKEGSLPLGATPDPRGEIKRAGKGHVLDIKTLQEIGEVLTVARELLSFYSKLDDKRSSFSNSSSISHLSSVFERLHSNPLLERRIKKSFTSDGFVSDEAGEKLKEIRGKIRHTQDAIQQKLRHLLHDSDKQKMLQDTIVTFRNGRYVVPVKEEFSGQFKGILHDHSSSGATSYMEPMFLLPDNNRLTFLKGEEKDEEQKIVADISSEVGECSEKILESCYALGVIDACRAVAMWAEKVGALPPILETSDGIKLLNARHPLLGERAVPVSLELTNEEKILVITGPNTGGKTVTLKTLGLFVLLAVSGFPVPGFLSLPPLDDLFVDLGDEQSIAQNLSTFSAHISYLVRTIPSVSDKSIVLLDEIGAGTDPEEGGALGIAILSHLAEKKGWVVATTHLGSVKVYAATTKGIVSGGMEFDLETLTPTYKLQMNHPGISLALQVAMQLGLPKNIIENAKNFRSGEWQKLEEYLASLTQKEKLLSKELLQTELKLAEIKEKETEITKIKEKLFQEESLLRERALLDAKKYLEDLKIKIEEEIKKEKETFSSIIQREEKVVFKELSKIDSLKEKSNSLPSPLSFQDIKPGLQVWVSSLGCEGEVTEYYSPQKIIVYAGQMEIKTNINDLFMLRSACSMSNMTSDSSKILQEPPFLAQHDFIASRFSVPNEVHLRGMTVEEALSELEKYLENCTLVSKIEVRIIHGKGQGILRKAIHQYLKSHPWVRTFRLGGVGEGGSGVTVVELS